MEIERTIPTVFEDLPKSMEQEDIRGSSSHDKFAPASGHVPFKAIKGSRMPLDLRSVRDSFKLNRNNYISWYSMVCRVLKAEGGAFMHLTDEGPKPGDSGYDEWRADDRIIFLWLMDSMIPEIRGWCSPMESAKEIWDRMHCTFFKSIRLFKMYDLRMKMRCARQEGRTVREYFNHLYGIWKEFELYGGNLRECPENKAPVNILSEKEKTVDFLIGLNPEYCLVKDQIFSGKELPSLYKVYQRILEEESGKRSTVGKDFDVNMGNLHLSENKSHSPGATVMANHNNVGNSMGNSRA